MTVAELIEKLLEYPQDAGVEVAQPINMFEYEWGEPEPDFDEFGKVVSL